MKDMKGDRKFLRNAKTIWCPGCGIGIVMRAMVRAISDMGISKDEVAVVSGIGCSGRMSSYLDFNTMHTTHGRALTFATGIKLANPQLHVIVVMGDGDAAAIGGNHLLHAARRNLDLTALVLNNSIYGMTGGQVSPMTPFGDMSSTTPYGNIDPAVDICGVADAAGATYVARWTTFHHHQLASSIKEGIGNHGFSLVEAMFQCPVQYGAKNRRGTAAEMLRSMGERSKLVDSVEGEPPEDTIVIGKLVERERREYGDSLAEVQRRANSG